MKTFDIEVITYALNGGIVSVVSDLHPAWLCQKQYKRDMPRYVIPVWLVAGKRHLLLSYISIS